VPGQGRRRRRQALLLLLLLLLVLLLVPPPPFLRQIWGPMLVVTGLSGRR